MRGATPTETARRLFAPLGPTYERWASVLSFGQDARWRRSMVDELDLAPGSLVLDVAAGTGSITRLLQGQGYQVVSLDQSAEMLSLAHARGASAVLGTAERLPFDDGTFDAVTFGYLLRYVDSVPAAMEELTRVVRTGGRIGMVEFGVPSRVWRVAWWLYTRIVLRSVGLVIGSGWGRVGGFLGPSIERFWKQHPPRRLAAEWRDAGIEDVRIRRMSLGGGLLMWGRRV